MSKFRLQLGLQTESMIDSTGSYYYEIEEVSEAGKKLKRPDQHE